MTQTLEYIDKTSDKNKDKKDRYLTQFAIVFIILLSVVCLFVFVNTMYSLKNHKEINLQTIIQANKKLPIYVKTQIKNYTILFIGICFIILLNYSNSSIQKHINSILLFSLVTIGLLFTKITFYEKISSSSIDWTTFIKKDSKLYDFIIFNFVFFVLFVFYDLTKNKVKIKLSNKTKTKALTEIIQIIFTIVVFFGLLVYFKDIAQLKYICIGLIIFYIFKIIHKIDIMFDLGMRKKMDMSIMEYSNYELLRLVQYVLNGLFLINFFS
uniref:Uncharacterized protein n=1 Tax=viral metagenome TaxID=1070528 RepID=A0A6C0BR48_9ZZZZ